MAGRLIDDDPEAAYQHALAASRRGGRIGAVREAVGMTAYAAGRYDDALREFRTFRRITGSSIHLAHMADCERGLGRPEKALELAHSDERNMLDNAGKAELAMVASGARADMGDYKGAVEELEIPQLDINRAFSFSPRLFEAYADALSAAGRSDEAAKWYRQIGVAESALGVGEFEEPEIMDLGWDEEEERREEEERAARSAAAAPQDDASDDGAAPHGGGVPQVGDGSPEGTGVDSTGGDSSDADSTGAEPVGLDAVGDEDAAPETGLAEDEIGMTTSETLDQEDLAPEFPSVEDDERPQGDA
ncbi:tetratricopeptide repeat protein [Sinomonas sp. R1AF57]|uniref:tetratricopeptide repeat protein n=1 Tax=Sinomonas sp. R1AF57 TaxID=2020377 RepID=UPI001C9CA071|nr:tetratricopeptide repeat protein [Sinomonas sp. R1AF57]